jgi:uncharacterized protein (TIGR00299 family) protein
MFIALLIDLGLSPNALEASLKSLNIEPFKFKVERVQKGAIAATHIHFKVGHSHEERSLKTIEKIIDQGSFSKEVKQNSKNVFRKLGEAEAHVHGVELNKIHFHEVGALDSILDVVGACVGLEMLGIEKIVHSPIPVGYGKTETEHGTIPVPAPATLELLKGMTIYQGEVKAEVTTPTGAALIATLSESSHPEGMPPMQVHKIGYGAGTMDFVTPNVLRGVCGDLLVQHPLPYARERINLLETNLDDLSPEIYDHLMERLLQAGAQDVSLETIQMKKNRPAQKLSVMASQEKTQSLATLIFRETSTLGIRIQEVHRLTLDREMHRLSTPWGEVNVKRAGWNGEVFTAKPEYEDCKRIAKEHNIPLKKVYQTVAALLHNPKAF